MVLLSIFLFLIAGIILIFYIPGSNLSVIRPLGLVISGFVLFQSTILISLIDFNKFYYQQNSYLSFDFNFLNWNLNFGLDGFSAFFFLLSSLLIFLCVLYSWKNDLIKEYIINLLVLELLLLLVFSVLDILLFYIFFEAILIPMFLLIGLFGSRARKIRAAYLLFFYTFVGSVLMLLGILYIYTIVGSLSLEYVSAYAFTKQEQQWLFVAFFLSFACKIPVFPFHIWLPEAHVEAPTVGSVVLAGILLKLGVYGFLRYSLPLFPDACFYFFPLIYLMCLLGVIYASFTAVRQTDIKRIVAYSSIAHMNLVVLGIFSFNLTGIDGALLQSISHGFVSGGLFFMIGILYERYHSRLLYYYSGLVHVMPLYATALFIFTLANIALPGTSGFVGEFLLLCSIHEVNVIACVLSTFGLFLGGAYSLWLYNRIIFGNLKICYTTRFKDLNYREIVLLLTLLIPVILMGLNPQFYAQGIQVASHALAMIYYIYI